MQLYERDYLNGLTEKEKTEYEEILAKHHFTTFQEMENKITYKALSDV